MPANEGILRDPSIAFNIDRESAYLTLTLVLQGLI